MNKNQYISFSDNGPYKKDVVFERNGVHIGSLWIDVDGYWIFEAGRDGGYYPDYILLEISQKMIAINAEVTRFYEQELAKYEVKE